MKNPFFALVATAALLAGSPAFAATARFEQGPGDRNQNYGYDRNHKVTPQERARWEAEHRNDKHDDKKDRHDDKRDDKKDRRDDKHDDKKDRRDDKHDDKKDRRDDKFDRNKNYGFDRDHKVTPQERARWEAQHRH